MTQPYDVPGKEPHDRTRWTWVDRGVNGGYWQAKGTRDKSYNCTAFLMAWLFPDARPAVWGDSNQFIETFEIEAELRRRGFAAGTSEACIPPARGSCAILYFPKKDDGTRGSEPYHVEVYDPIHGDWVGKGGPGSPIQRRQDPRQHPSEPSERAKTEYVFYCRADYAPDPAVTDAEIHSAARRVMPPPPPPPPPPPVPQPPRYSPPWLMRLWSWVFGIIIGIFAGWALFA